jgi:uncharacterized protein
MRFPKMVVEILKIGAAVAIGLPVFLYFFQDRMLFYPMPAANSVPTPARGELESVSLVAGDGVTLSGWFVRSGAPRAPLVIYFGGNAEEVSWLIGMADRFAGHSLLLLNYRGYGGSGGKPSEAALFADALLAYDWARQRQDIDPTRIIAFGRSLGSGVAVHLAAHRPLAGAVLVSPYDSVRALAQSIYPWLPVGLLLKHPFDSMSHAGAITVPVLCVVAERDRVIPVPHSRRLFDAWGGKDRRWIEVRGAGHDDVSGEPRYWDEITLFLTRLAARPS